MLGILILLIGLELTEENERAIVTLILESERDLKCVWFTAINCHQSQKERRVCSIQCSPTKHFLAEAFPTAASNLLVSLCQTESSREAVPGGWGPRRGGGNSTPGSSWGCCRRWGGYFYLWKGSLGSGPPSFPWQAVLLPCSSQDAEVSCWNWPWGTEEWVREFSLRFAQF